jgi:hypothetical protein
VISLGSDRVAVVKCGTGQGDLLTGSLGTFYCWAVLPDARDLPELFQRFHHRTL